MKTQTYIITELTWYICKWLVLNNWDILNWDVHDNWDKNIFSLHFSYNVHTVPTLLNLNVLSLISRVSCFWVFYVRFHFVYLNIVDKHNFANVLWIFEFFCYALMPFFQLSSDETLTSSVFTVKFSTFIFLLLAYTIVYYKCYQYFVDTDHKCCFFYTTSW